MLIIRTFEAFGCTRSYSTTIRFTVVAVEYPTLSHTIPHELCVCVGYIDRMGSSSKVRLGRVGVNSF